MWAGRGPTPGSKRRGAPTLRPAKGRRQGAHRADRAPPRGAGAGATGRSSAESSPGHEQLLSGAARPAARGVQVTPRAAGMTKSPPPPAPSLSWCKQLLLATAGFPLQQDTQIVSRLALVPAAGWAEDLPAAGVISGQKLGAKQALTGSTGHLSSLASWEGEGGAGRTLWRRALTLVSQNPKAPTPSTKELPDFAKVLKQVPTTHSPARRTQQEPADQLRFRKKRRKGGREGGRKTLAPPLTAHTYFFTLASPLGILRNFFFLRILTALRHSVSESSTSFTFP